MIKKFITRVGTFFGIQAILLSCVLPVYIQNRDKAVHQSYIAATIDKHELLSKQSGPKLIFVGGSSVAFGIDSEYIAEKIGYSPVNMGLHWGFGLEFFLREIEYQLRPEDIVVLSLEYDHFVSQKPAVVERLFLALESRPRNVQIVPAYYLPSLFDKALIQLGSMLRKTKRSLEGSLEIHEIYRRSSFNAVGDMVKHHSHKSEDLSQTQRDLSNVTSQKAQRAVHMLNDFTERAERLGATVVYSYPPFLRHVFESNEKEINLIQQELQANAKFMIIDQPEDFALTGEYFFDTEYHLNLLGKQLRARHIVQKLRMYAPKAISQVENRRP